MKKTKNKIVEAEAMAVVTKAEAPPLHVPSVEEIAQTAYAIIAEELKWKGDFPEWDKISERARTLYVESVEHVQTGKPPRTRFEEIVAETLKG